MPFRTLRFTQRRSLVTSLFGVTFIATVATVSASTFLPCPVRTQKGRYMDVEKQENVHSAGVPIVVVAGRPKRWIEEKQPPRTSFKGS